MKGNVRFVIDAMEIGEKKGQPPPQHLCFQMLKKNIIIFWNFLQKLLQNLYYGYKFDNWIPKICTEEKARILISGILKRQGCPLSQLLFIITMEICCSKITQDPHIEGLKCDVEQFKLKKPYVYDVILAISTPHMTLQYIMDYKTYFGSFSRFKTNQKKNRNNFQIFNQTKENVKKIMLCILAINPVEFVLQPLLMMAEAESSNRNPNKYLDIKLAGKNENF